MKTTLSMDSEYNFQAAVTAGYLKSLQSHDGLIVDNFAGGGGASTGIELALGRKVDVAINHDFDAIAMHKANHPGTVHLCDDVWKVDPREFCNGRPIALAWFSPDCKHFSKAKGGKPVNKKIRGLAWVMAKYSGLPAEIKPRIMILENVEEFKTWGPIDETTHMPIKEKAGLTFHRFIAQLRNNGYQVDHRELVAADYGAPTKRKRFFIIARCDGKPIVWPEKTHAPRGKTKPGQKEWVAASTIIDFSIPCPSIFDRKKELAIPTKRRIGRGLTKFVLDNPHPFIINSSANFLTKIGQTGFSLDRSRSLTDPAGTVVSKNEDVICSVGLTPIGYGEAEKQQPRIHDISEPLPTIVSSGKHNATVAKIAPYVYINNFQNKGFSITDPTPTCTTSETKNRIIAPLLTPFVSQNFGGFYDGKGTNPLSPLPTITAMDHNRLIVPMLMDFQFINQEQRKNLDLKEPHPTIAAGGQHSALITPFINKFDWYDNLNDVREPMTTILTGGGGKMGLTQPEITELGKDFIVKMFHTSNVGSIEEPMDCVMPVEKYARCRVILTKYDKASDLGKWPKVRAFINEYCGYTMADDEILILAFKKKTGESMYYIRDIGMRMLTPRELYDAQGFPHDYIIDHDFKGNVYPKSKQVARCGNAVPPPFAEALVRANMPNEATKTKIDKMSKLHNHHEQLNLFQ